MRFIKLLSLLLLTQCLTFNPIPGKEAAIDSAQIKLLSIFGPMDTFSYGQFTYSPRDVTQAMWVFNVQYSGTGKVDPVAVSLEEYTMVDKGKESLNMPVRVHECCYSNSFGFSTNPFQNLANIVNRSRAGGSFMPDAAIPLQGGEPERRMLVFVFPRNKTPTKLSFHPLRDVKDETAKIDLGLTNTP
ncbi:MAG TPA: hypothetical protein PKE49_13230 [Leptospiraceae bacterium]|jgi:hypothetical protein|nr:hypothetical protein [Leptospirales bacterium]HMX57482.1 hypothetical protein [Leptospiraceae bacterium]HMY45251.1 hypothetical protein [Leptospiraceae bacterium]HMZ36420.1 hypothetical protein [Leptospiraceae bacterium]HNE22421.1 hypothetical protein [Leptospiraceae bacterium]